VLRTRERKKDHSDQVHRSLHGLFFPFFFLASHGIMGANWILWGTKMWSRITAARVYGRERER
jgi:hypothetical protein